MNPPCKGLIAVRRRRRRPRRVVGRQLHVLGLHPVSFHHCSADFLDLDFVFDKAKGSARTKTESKNLNFYFFTVTL